MNGIGAGDCIAGHVRSLKHRHDLIADELVDVAIVAGHQLGLLLKIEIDHLDDRLGVAALGKGRVAADIGEKDGDFLARAAQAHAHIA